MRSETTPASDGEKFGADGLNANDAPEAYHMCAIAQTTGREQPTMSTNVIAIAGMAGLTSESQSAELPVSSVAVGRLHREREG
jgi:hypothetical protein